MRNKVTKRTGSDHVVYLICIVVGFCLIAGIAGLTNFQPEPKVSSFAGLF